MKKIRYFCLILCLILLLQGMSIGAAAAEADVSVTNGCHTVNAARPLSESKQLVETSKAVILFELNSDTLLYAWNPDTTIYPASMVKLMTAIIALERGSLTDTVEVTRAALNQVAIGSVSAGLKAGEHISLEALLYCMMTASANDAAVVIAEHIAGSQEAFVYMMNEKAAQLGCTGTHYSNAHGLHDEQTYTTARDICRIMDYALENPQFKALFTAKNYTVPATDKSDSRYIQTTNYMMSKEYTSKYFDARVTGGKTGATDQAGRCLVLTAEAGGMNLLGIVMGAVPTYEEEGIILKTHGSFEEMQILLDHAFDNYEYRQIFYQDQALKQYPVSGGTNSVVVSPVSRLATVLPVGIDESRLTWTYDDNIGTITAPVKQGQKISAVQVWLDNNCLAQTELVAINAVDVYQAPTESLKPGDIVVDDSKPPVWLWVIGVLLGVIVLIVVCILIARGVAIAKARSRIRRRRRNRRRTR